MKTVLVTGADGFIGSHLTELLVNHGYSVKALSCYNSFNSWGWLDDVKCINDIEVLVGDVRDPHFCKRVTKKVDVVFHLAALIAIPYSYVAPDSYFETNVKGTLNICQAALENGVERLIHTSTSEVYGTAQYVPINESHPMQPQSPYSASKIAADAMAKSFHAAFDLPLTIARPFNTYGPRQSARAVIPTIICQIATGFKEIRLGDISPTRDFNYVEDTCNGFLALARCESAVGNTVNIASNCEISIKDMVEIICDLMEADVRISIDEQRLRPEKSEVKRLWGDNRLFYELTGCVPAYDIKAGLQKTIEWLKHPENLAKYKAKIYNV